MSALPPGLRVLLVEDEAIIAMTAEDMLADLGCVVVATASTVAEAVAHAADDGLDVALLDINLNGERSTPAAAALAARGVPFAFTTGYGAAGRPDGFPDAPLVTKPYRAPDLAAAIVAAMGIASSATPSSRT